MSTKENVRVIKFWYLDLEDAPTSRHYYDSERKEGVGWWWTLHSKLKKWWWKINKRIAQLYHAPGIMPDALPILFYLTLQIILAFISEVNDLDI